MSRRRRNDGPFSLFAFQDIITAVTGILILITLILALSLVDKPLEVSPEMTKDVQALKAEVASMDSDLSRFADQVDSDHELIEMMAKHGAADQQQLIELLENALADGKELLKANRKQTNTTSQQVVEVVENVNSQKLDLGELLSNIARNRELTQKMIDSNRVIYEWSKSGVDQPWLVDVNSTEWLAAPVGREQKPNRFTGPNLRSRLAQMEAWYRSLPSHEQYLILSVRPRAVDSWRLIRASTVLQSADFGTDLIPNDVTIIDSKTGAVVR